MATRAAKASAMCCVSIDFNTYLLPADKGLRLVELMQDAVRCRERYGGGRLYELHPDPPEISMTLVKASQITQPEGEPAVGRRPAQLFLTEK